MNPYISANTYSLIKALHCHYLQGEAHNWLPAPPERPARPLTPSTSLISFKNLSQSQYGASQLAGAARACRDGKQTELCVSETFHEEEALVAYELLELEKELSAPRLAQKILLQPKEAPSSQVHYELSRPEGTYWFWSRVGYHAAAQTPLGQTYGIETTIGFSFRAQKRIKTQALNPRKTPRRPQKASSQAVSLEEKNNENLLVRLT